LYQWAEAVQYQNGASKNTSPSPPFSGNVRGICPTGWHLPSDAEWTTLENTLGGSNVAGTALKSVNNGNGNNSSGFNALQFSGFREPSGFSYSGSFCAFFWSSSESSSIGAINRRLNPFNSVVNRYSDYKYYGYSVRCLKD
jgi:uncharacterized protein (TIGR02145 family)